MTFDEFISRWRESAANERANKDLFLSELCDVLGVPRPEPATGETDRDRYVFEKPVVKIHEGKPDTIGKIDLYKHDAFILEAKQGSDAESGKLGKAKRNTPSWNIVMNDAFGQALGYSRSFEKKPPFLIVPDIGYCFDLYASFDGSGNYRPFPDPLNNRVFLTELSRHAETLRAIWTDPHSLDPSRRAARVTRDIASHLANLARALEAAGHDPEVVAKFLMRCLFTMFVEDVGLIREQIFTRQLHDHWIERPDLFPGEVEALWKTMNEGGSLFGVGTILQFNGGLFADQTALPLTKDQIIILGLAAACDWREVEPAIFGTLLERALDPKERHRLGAHYTPRAYVERLVRPTIEEPVREEWDLARAEVRQILAEGKGNDDRKTMLAARKPVYRFYDRLTELRVLDPACGSGNFLYVTLDLFKRIEGEVHKLLQELGDTSFFNIHGRTVSPRQFLGIEVKPWAKEITELVLWIGWLQWQIRSKGWLAHPPEPVLEDYHNIECRDAVLAWDRTEPLLDDEGNPVTRWDGETMKISPVTGEEIPDETASVPVVRYVNPRKAEWPNAEFIVGNPPYIGTKRMRQALGHGYVDALRSTYAPAVQDNADFVMYWWEKAALAVRGGVARRFGLITTNSITQAFNRRVVAAHVEAVSDPLAIVFAVPDHPWVDSENGAAVRVGMTVGAGEQRAGRLLRVAAEDSESGSDGAVVVTLSERIGLLNSALGIGVNPASAVRLRANEGLCTNGVALHGQGFVVDPERAARLRATGPTVIKPYRGGRDLLRVPRELYVVDFSFTTEGEARALNPEAFQHVIDYVKPERDHNNRASIRKNWWRFAWERPVLQAALKGLRRYIATTETSKHRIFQFLPSEVVPDHMILAIASDDAAVLGLLSSRTHVVWALRAGGTLEDRPRYNKSVCFDPYPLVNTLSDSANPIRELAEQIDSHRKVRQANYGLAMTDVYNVLEKSRNGQPFTKKEKDIHDKGLVSVLLQLHEELDRAVFDAYGWPHNLTDEEILERLVLLNHERAEEEKRGIVRWLRPEFQNPGGAGRAEQSRLAIPDDDGAEVEAGAKPAKKRDWPESLPERIIAVRDLLAATTSGLTSAAAARHFRRARTRDVEDVLQSLQALGLAVRQAGEDGVWRSA